MSTRPSNPSKRHIEVARSLCEEVEKVYAEEKKQTEEIMTSK